MPRSVCQLFTNQLALSASFISGPLTFEIRLSSKKFDLLMAYSFFPGPNFCAFLPEMSSGEKFLFFSFSESLTSLPR